ncbi:MAG: SMC family ATPase, partial [Lachnospiraceae bacterium]|nr:SMC family ATPase [Lachnospiraceae bacterium]
MKPQFIKMKAFGSYCDERIDFSDVQQGLFLITGDTGAGKTTIFDAIMFALYGETSGGKREGKMMRSQYAPEGMETEVEFGFSYRGERYIIKRRPQQPRYKKNKQTGKFEELKTQMSARVELIMPDGKEFPGKIAQINEKIIQIIGLNADQFTQVAMLAQGDFVKLLHASSKDRKEIFAKMFDTRIYGCIQDELRQRYMTKTKELYGNRKDIVRELQEISLVKGSRYEEIWNSDFYLDSNGDHFSESDAEGLSALIEKIRKEAQEREADIQEERKKNEERIARIHAVLENAALINGQLDRLTERKQHLKTLSEQAEEISQLGAKIRFAEKAEQMIPFYKGMIEKGWDVQESRNQVKKLKKRMEAEERRMAGLKERAESAKVMYEERSPGLQIAIDQIEKNLDQYDIYEKVQKEQEVVLKELEYSDKRIQRLEGQIALYEDQSAILAEEIGELKSAVCNVEVLEARLKGEIRRKEDLNEIFEDLDKLDLFEQSVSIKEQTYKKAKAEVEKRESAYLEYQQKFIANQAFILRSQLEVGKPCPVCGKIHEKTEEVVDNVPNEKFDINETTLKKLQSRKESSDAEYMAARSALDVATTKKENLKLNGQRKLKRIFDNADGFDLSWKMSVEQQLQNVEIEIEKYRKKIQENAQMQEQITTKEILLVEKKQQKTDCEKALRDKKEQREAYDKKVGICETQIAMLASQLAFQTKSEAEAELERRKLELSKISYEKKECETAFADADKIYTASRGEL